MKGRPRFLNRFVLLALLVAGFGGAYVSPAQSRATLQAEPRGLPQESSASDPETQLRTGISLTGEGRFREAIPYFLAARGRVAEDYAENFNLALCYVATGENKPAIEILSGLRASGHATSEVDNLLAQAFIGDGQSEPALAAFQQAVSLTPKYEKLYLFVADAAMQKKSFGLGLKVVDLGIANLPDSSRLHYQRALFLTNLERYDLAQKEFDLCMKLAPGSDFAYLSAVQENLVDGDVQPEVSAAREGVRHYPDNYVLLQLLGEALLHSGASPGQPSFEEARKALERSVELHPEYARSQVSLGKVYLMENRLDDAIAHLETARQLAPDDTSVYSHLASAYRRKGEPRQAQKMLSILANLNNEQTDKIRAGPPARGGATASPD